MDLFNKYYQPSEGCEELIKNALICFDTSALLDIYYYSEKARAEIFKKILPVFKDRLWIPSHVFFEFCKNKRKVSAKPSLSYDSLVSEIKGNNDSGYVAKIKTKSISISKTINEIETQLQTLKERTKKTDKHPWLPSNSFSEFEASIKKIKRDSLSFEKSVEDFESLILKKCEDQKKIILSQGDEDPVEQSIISLFSVCDELSYHEMIEYAKEGDFRYKEKIAPGFKDNEKEGLQKYGDLFVWKEIIRLAKNQKNNLILITNDKKPDWFDEETSAPRYELLKEFNSESGSFFWTLDMSSFLYLVNKMNDSKVKVSNEVIEEANEIQIAKTYVELDDNKCLDLIRNFFINKIDIFDQVEIPESCRVFGKLRLFEGELLSSGNRVYIVVNFPSNANYSNAIHSLRNAFEIKKYYSQIEDKLFFYQISILGSSKSVQTFYNKYVDKPNAKKLFLNKTITSILAYIENDSLLAYKDNLEE